MPHGFFTVEQWKRSQIPPTSNWVPILHLDAYQSLSKTIAALEKRDRPGLYRVVQTQRCIWAQREGGKLRLHGTHASSPAGLARLAEIFEHEGGRRPVEQARQERARAKAKRAAKR